MSKRLSRHKVAAF